jgi:hypothetical protein
LEAGQKADNFVLLKKKNIIITKFVEMKPGSTLAESSKKVCASKWPVLPMVIMASVLMKLKMHSN